MPPAPRSIPHLKQNVTMDTQGRAGLISAPASVYVFILCTFYQETSWVCAGCVMARRLPGLQSVPQPLRPCPGFADVLVTLLQPGLGRGLQISPSTGDSRVAHVAGAWDTSRESSSLCSRLNSPRSHPSLRQGWGRFSDFPAAPTLLSPASTHALPLLQQAEQIFTGTCTKREKGKES